MEKTDIILRELEQDEINKRYPFTHFGREGNSTFSFMTISEGYWKSANVLCEYMQANKDDFAIVDSLIYPLFFNYRHSIETYLKALFFEYGEQTNEARRKFLEIGHDLNTLWNTLRKSLSPIKKHVECSVKFDAVKHYIAAINDFDSDSMVMRYPINKNLTQNKKIEHHFDYINFCEKMNDLCKSLRQIEYDLSNTITTTATQDELDEYLQIFEKYKSDINHFFNILQEETQTEKFFTYRIDNITELLFDVPTSPKQCS